MKRKIETIIECILLLIINFTFNAFLYPTYDHMIDFTHCFSIASGLTIYNDFNIVIGPVYPYIMAFFLSIFGKNFIIFDLINSIITILIYLLIKKNNPNNKSLFIFFIFTPFVLIAKYNTFTLLLFYIIYYLENKNYKYKDYLIGFLLAILLFTKINIGVFLILPTLILHYKNKKTILNRFITFFITSLVIILLMIINKSLYNFMNYTVFGLFDFANSSSSFQKSGISIAIINIIVTMILFLLMNIKKDRKVIYMLCYLIMSYPTFDYSHTTLSIIPTLIYMVDKVPNKKIFKIINYSICTVTAILIIGLNINKISFKNIDCKRKYCIMDRKLQDTFENIHGLNELLKKYDNTDKIYYLNYFAYYYKLDRKQPINKFDFIWEGNLGYNGEEKYINDIKKECKKNSCIFIIDITNVENREKNEKISLKILKYITDNYNLKENILNTFVYTNEKDNNQEMSVNFNE